MMKTELGQLTTAFIAAKATEAIQKKKGNLVQSPV